jgi:peptidoglycan/xylan/chitin deacetylase (PgdA/CDA1 family)
MILLWGAVAVVGLGLGYWLFASPYSQLFGRYPYGRASADRVVALTFDDGPNEPYTSQIADHLSSRDIRATFFQVGTCVQRFPETTARLVAAGHVIGNHSWSHRLHTYLVPGRIAREIDRTQEILKLHSGRIPALYRSPWLFRQPLLLRAVRRRSLQPVSGEFCHALEVFQPDGARIARRAVAKAKPGSILIFHDGFDGRGGDRSETVRAVQLVTAELRRRGYRFVTVDELLDVPAYLGPAPSVR